MERGAELALQGHTHILENRELRKHGADLEGAHDAEAGDIRGFSRVIFLPR
jgi:hypothetical protein